MDAAGFFQRGADPADAAIHHVRRRHDVDARFGLRKGLLFEHSERHIVDDVARFVDHAILSVRGVRIKRYIGHDAQFRKAFFEFPHYARDQAP